MSLVKYANLAQMILNQKTRYLKNKKLIQKIFKTPSDNSKDTIQFRLTIIDSYYSTQMSKRLYGIETIVESLSVKNDNELKTEIVLFLNNPEHNGFLKKLFSKTYGINKEGKNFGKAISLLSKYCYFINDCNFPIYDTIAKVAYPLLTNGKIINEENYFTLIKELNEKSGINNYEKLDNLMWILGKIKSGSFSILMNIDKYKIITENIQFDSKDSSKLKDERIREYIKVNYNVLEIFTPVEKEFLKFVFALK